MTTETINTKALSSLDAALKFARWETDAAFDNLDAKWSSLATDYDSGTITKDQLSQSYAEADSVYQQARNEALRRFLRLENLIIASDPATARHWRSIKGNTFG